MKEEPKVEREEPTSGLETLSCSGYELACGYPIAYHPVSVRGLL
jgi:hypothetical protein